MGDPPGGPPDRDPPLIVRVEPDSGAVLAQPPRAVNVILSEVVNERIAAQKPDIGGAVILSPARGLVNVSWHRDRLEVKPKEGFRLGRVYRLEILPVLTDLRQNRMREGRLVVFSTGPAIPASRLSGALVDWAGGRAGAAQLVEAVLLPDSLPYRAATDSSGTFDLPLVPPGEYLVYGVIDQNNDRARGPREAFDTVRVVLADTASVELFAFTHDTTGPRLRTIETGDSITVKLVFDRPLDPTLVLDSTMVTVTLQQDSTMPLPVAGVYTQRGLDSLRARETAARDSARAAAARDTTRAAGAPAARDTAAPAGRPGPQRPVTRAPGGAPAPRADSTRVMHMLARRPPPTDTRFVRLGVPLVVDTRYTIVVDGARSLSGISGTARGQLNVQRPREPARRPRRPPADSTRAPTDTAAARADSTRERTDTLGARRDTVPAPADTARPRRDSTRTPADSTRRRP